MHGGVVIPPVPALPASTDMQIPPASLTFSPVVATHARPAAHMHGFTPELSHAPPRFTTQPLGPDPPLPAAPPSLLWLGGLVGHAAHSTSSAPAARARTCARRNDARHGFIANLYRNVHWRGRGQSRPLQLDRPTRARNRAIYATLPWPA
jgi:hypothetical protein